MINGKAKVYDTFAPIIQCVYNKLTQKFNTNNVLIVIMLVETSSDTTYSQERDFIGAVYRLTLKDIEQEGETTVWFGEWT